MLVPKQSCPLANGPSKGHDAREPRVSRQHSEILKTTARPCSRNVLTIADHMGEDAGVPFVAENAAADRSSRWLEIQVTQHDEATTQEQQVPMPH